MLWKEVREALEAIEALCGPAIPLDLAMHKSALEIAAQTGYHIYDALIVAAAMRAGCDLLYSEDMQDGRSIEDLTIRNPFGARGG